MPAASTPRVGSAATPLRQAGNFRHLPPNRGLVTLSGSAAIRRRPPPPFPRSPPPMAMDTIRIRGARTHNLKNIDLDLPRDRLIVITGLSGSGKNRKAHLRNSVPYLLLVYPFFPLTNT